MAWQMHHFEMSVAEINDLAILNGLDAGSWVDRIGTQVEVREWYGIDNGAGDFTNGRRLSSCYGHVANDCYVCECRQIRKWPTLQNAVAARTRPSQTIKLFCQLRSIQRDAIPLRLPGG